MSPKPRSKTPGVLVRQTKDGRISYRAEVWDNTARKTITKTFPTISAAKQWRVAKMAALRAGTDGAVDAMTLSQAAEEWLARADGGVIRTQGGARYKPSTLRRYRAVLELHVLPALGSRKLTDIKVDTVQAFIDKLAAAGQSRSSIRNALAPLRIIFHDAMRRRRAHSNPVTGLMVGGTEAQPRDRIAAPAEVVELLAALPERDRPLWATAFYAGLRCGELMALRWEDVNIPERTLAVARSYDPKEKQFVGTKTRAGTRVLPFPERLVPYLAAQRLATVGEGLVFGEDGVLPFGYTGVRKRALKAWADTEPITLHECRHTYASLMLAAGVDMTKVSKWMGHSSITITVDRYGHLVPGSAAEDMARFEQYLGAA